MEFKLRVVELNQQSEKLKAKQMQVYKTVLIKKDGQVGMSQKAMLTVNLLDEAGLHKPGDVLTVNGEIHLGEMLNKEGEKRPVQWFEPA